MGSIKKPRHLLGMSVGSFSRRQGASGPLKAVRSAIIAAKYATPRQHGVDRFGNYLAWTPNDTWNAGAIHRGLQPAILELGSCSSLQPCIVGEPPGSLPSSPVLVFLTKRNHSVARHTHLGFGRFRALRHHSRQRIRPCKNIAHKAQRCRRGILLRHRRVAGKRLGWRCLRAHRTTCAIFLRNPPSSVIVRPNVIVRNGTGK
jgi:hypothetical protein